MSNQAVLTLLSDFSDRDIYVAVMKGVISQINPQLRLMDLTHHIPPQNIAAARFCLMNACPYFPEGTVHLAVVDPGVGSQRRAIAVQYPGGFLVGPDNGIFSGVLAQTPAIAAFELTNPQYWRTHTPSKTFHGRDIFAPVAAYLASGVPISHLGQQIDPTTLRQINIIHYQQTPTTAKGCIQYIDSFGNLVSNIPESFVRETQWCLKVGGLTIPGCETYSNVKVGEPLALVESNGWIEIAINGGNANSQLQINLKDPVEVIRVE